MVFLQVSRLPPFVRRLLQYRGIFCKGLLCTVIIFMIGISTIMSYVMTFTGIPKIIAAALLGLISNKIVVLLLINIFCWYWELSWTPHLQF